MEDFSRHWKSKFWMNGEYDNEGYDFSSKGAENTGQEVKDEKKKMNI